MKLPSLALTVLLCASALPACGSSTPNYPYSDLRDPRKEEIKVGVEDRLSIRVRNNDDLSTDVNVRPDGKITLPLIGDVRAQGKTPKQLTKEISDRLSQYVRDPQAVVTVAVTEYKSYRFTVSGEVVSPGIFGSQRFVSVLEAIQMAGGPTRFAKKDKIRIIRCCDEAGDKIKVPISYEALLKGNTEMNVYILPGDLILVP